MAYKKKILITGGAGFIGSHLVETLANKGYRVIVIDLLEQKFTNPNIKTYVADIRDSKLMSNIITNEEVKCIVHLAALINVDESIRKPLYYHDVNVNGTKNVCELSLEYKIK